MKEPCHSLMFILRQKLGFYRLAATTPPTKKGRRMAPLKEYRSCFYSLALIASVSFSYPGFSSSANMLRL